MDPINSLLSSGLNSRLHSLDLLANNLSNASSTGFKADRERFAAYLSADAAQALAAGESPTLSEMPLVEDHFTDFRQGPLTETGGATDCSLEGPGFFSVETPRGVRYTRSGGFRLGADGELRTREGYRVRVKGAEDSSRLGADPREPVEIDAAGEVRQSGRALGWIDRVDFAKPELLRKEEAVYFRAPPGLREYATSTQLRSGTLESSNVDSAQASFRLVETTRQFGLLQRAFNVQDGLQRGLIERVARW